MKIRRGYKVELDLNNTQITACLKHAGCARFAYNWGLERKKQAFRNLAHAAYELLGLPPVRRELTPLEIVSDLGNQATVAERGTEHG